jgi:hypothetical protein
VRNDLHPVVKFAKLTDVVAPTVRAGPVAVPDLSSETDIGLS